jgi:hypothetical protein
LEAKKEPTDLEKFSALVEKLKKHGFRVVERKEMSGYHNAIKLMPPKGRKPRPGQVALLYTHISGMQVLCWPTFSRKTNSFIEKAKASAWVLTLNNNREARHKSRMIRRTGKFVNRILKECLIHKARIDASAYCPSCGAPMKLEWSKKFLRGRYWICTRAKDHQQNQQPLPRFGMNNGLSGNLLTLVNRRTKKRNKYARKRKAEGKDPQHQMKNRKPWNKGVPT